MSGSALEAEAAPRPARRLPADGDRLTDLTRAYQDLLDRDLVRRATEPDVYARIEIQLPELRRWFATEAGWEIVRTPQAIRLLRQPAAPDGGYGWDDLEDRLDYALVAWVLWYAEGVRGDRFLLSTLAADLAARLNPAEAPPVVDWSIQRYRQALRRAIEALVGRGALEVLDGDTESFSRSSHGNALLLITPLTRAFGGPVPELVYAALIQYGDPSPLVATPGARVPPRQRLWRALLLRPALVRDEDPEAFALLATPAERRRVDDEARRCFGWLLEVTRTYAALLRPAEQRLKDRGFPGQTHLTHHVTHVVLLLATALQERVRLGTLRPAEAGRLHLAPAEFTQMLIQIQQTPTYHLGKLVRELSPAAITEQVEAMLRRLGFARREVTTGALVLSPLLGRFHGLYREDRQGLSIAPAGDTDEEAA